MLLEGHWLLITGVSTTDSIAFHAAREAQERSERQPALVGLDFHGEVSWPIYDWMGVAKAALAGVNRYLARYLGPHGVRCNLVAAGPLRTVSATAIPGFDDLASLWKIQAPLGWDWNDPAPTARVACMLLSRWSSGITGEIVHVDGGFHAMGAPLQSKLATLIGEPATDPPAPPELRSRA
jgi:enoyl-[acyl-carrier protein] reductase I